MKVRFLLNEELRSGVKKGDIKAKELINYLLTYNNVTTFKNDNITLADLFINGCKVVSASIDSVTFEIELITEDSETIAEGINFIRVNNGRYEMTTVSERIEIKGNEYYRIEGSNEIFTKDYILNQLSKHELLLTKLQKQEERNKQIEAERIAEAEAEERRIKEYNFCYGYTDNKTALQSGKILKALNKNVVYNDKLYSRKELIHKLIEESSECKTNIFNNDTRTKKVNGERVKLKTRIEYEFHFDGSIIDVTKTEYDYINYLLSNNLVGIYSNVI